MTALTCAACGATLLLAAFLTFRVVVRQEYLRRGRLGCVASLLESLIWGPFFASPYLYAPSFPAIRPGATVVIRVAQHAGLGLIVSGIVIVLILIGVLGMRRSFGQRVDVLQTTGPYRVTRNPQILAGYLIVVGVGLRWPSWYALGWVALYVVMAHMMVRTEEEHLLAVFGSAYADYFRRVARYVGRRSARV